MYTTLLFIHNAMRWLFLAAALVAIGRAIAGLMNKSPYTTSDNKTGTVFLSLAHTQLLIGIILLFVSEHVQAALSGGFGNAMKDSATRLLVMEHPLTMIIGVALIQIGRIKVRKAYEDRSRHMRSLMYYGIGVILILSRIPWHAPLMRSL